MAREGTPLWIAPGHGLGTWENIVVQIRTGELTVEALLKLETEIRLWRVRQQGIYDKWALLLIAGRGAPPVAKEVAGPQREIFVTLANDPRLYMGLVVEGNDIRSTAVRIATRALMMGAKRRTIWPTIHEAARWCVASAGASHAPSALVGFVESLRQT